MLNVDFEAMEEEYKNKIKELTSCSNYTANLLAKELLSLHSVSKCEPINSCDDEVINKAIKKNLTMKFSDGTLRKYHDDWGQATPTHVYV